MDRLVEHVVAWHNSHPLAKKITIYDVHTMGVVALPFLRSGASHGGAPVEPMLDDGHGMPPMEAVALGESTLDAHAANTTAEHLDALADQEEPPARARTKLTWQQRLSAVASAAFWRRGPPGKSGKSGKSSSGSWPAYSERFISIGARRVADFAQRQGFLNPPGDASWPQRVVPIDEKLLSKHSGAWPYEIYLLTAAIDAGTSRTRVLIGMGRKPKIIGPRCWSPLRLGLAALVLVGLLAMGLALRASLSKTAEAPESVPPVASSASAASAAFAVSASSTAASGQVTETEAASAASQAGAEAVDPAASGSPTASLAPGMTGSVAASGASSGTASVAESGASAAALPASAPPPDIRPQLVTPIPKRTPFSRPKADEAESGGKALKTGKTDKADKTDKPDENSAAGSAPGKDAGHSANKPQETRPVDGKASPSAKHGEELPAAPLVEKIGPLGKAEDRTIHSVLKPDAKQEAKTVVALVGPVVTSKSDAEAAATRLLGLIAPLHPSALHTSVVQTPDGWRPAVWPFDNRQEAQLINATLVARGLKTKAVDF